MATVAEAEETSQAEDRLREAGGAMMMLVSSEVWETLRRQASAERRSVGSVLSDALQQYVDRNPCRGVTEDPLGG